MTPNTQIVSQQNTSIHNMRSSASKSVTGTQAIDRALTILTEILESETPVSFTHLVKQTKLTKGTTSRIITALRRNGLIRKTYDGYLEPGRTLNKFAISGNRHNNLLHALRPTLETIANDTKESVIVSVAGIIEVESIIQIDSPFMLSSSSWVGIEVPYHASAAGKILLAHNVSNIPAIPLKKLTDKTIVNKNKLKKELDTILNKGFATSIDELEEGLTSISTPIFDDMGRACATISISGPSIRITRNAIDELAQYMIQKTQKIKISSRRIGAAQKKLLTKRNR